MRTRIFSFQSKISASADELFNWHAQNAVFDRLIPLGQAVELISKDPGLNKGVRTEIRMGHPPFCMPNIHNAKRAYHLQMSK